MKKIYVVMCDWHSQDKLDEGTNISGIFSKKEDAIKRFNEILEEEKENYALGQDPDIILERNTDSFHIYEKGNYFENHFNCNIVTTELN